MDEIAEDGNKIKRIIITTLIMLCGVMVAVVAPYSVGCLIGCTGNPLPTWMVGFSILAAMFLVIMLFLMAWIGIYRKIQKYF